jgi:glycosyltransferase involved in cell wall biosynthesis
MILLLAEELRRRGWNVVPVGPARGTGWLAAQFRQAGFEPATFTLRFPLDPFCALGMIAMLRRRGVRFLHSHEFTMAFYGSIAARALGLPHVVTMHGGTNWAQRSRRRAALRWAFSGRTTLVGVSRAGAKALEDGLKLPRGRVLVVPNGVPPSRLRGTDVRRELGLDADTLLLVSVGNLYPVKGHDILLRALARLDPAKAGNWSIAIAGRGGEEPRLRAQVAELGLSSRVRFLGFRTDVGDILAAANLFVLPSRSESHPLAVLEAMFAGLPIIAAAVGGVPDTIRHDVEGLLVPPVDPEALAVAIQDLLSDPCRRSRLGKAAAERARADFTVEAMADAYERLYEAA